MNSPGENDRFGSGEFAGQVRAHLESIGRTLDEIKVDMREMRATLFSNKVCTARLKTQMRVLWAAAGVFGITLLGLTLKLLLGEGA